jgi:hypothetical protein
MFTPRPRQGTHPRTAAPNVGARLRRLAAALTAITFGLLATAVTVPAAFARPMPMPIPIGDQSGPVPVTPPATTVRVIAVGGMVGWQITLIAVGAALVGAAATLLLVRARTAHRATLATSD